MADNTIKIFSTSRLEGPGFNAAGEPRPNKVRVIGEITEDDYDTGGVVIAPQRLGLTKIDFIRFSVVSVTDSNTVPSASAVPDATFVYGTNTMIVLKDMHTPAENDDTHDCVVRFEAFGESAKAPELLP